MSITNGRLVNDAWRIRPNLTLNLGLRYEYYGVQHNKNPELDSNFYFGSGSTLQERIRNGSVQIAKDSPVGGLWQKDKNNFAPRVGFAWDIFGDGKTSLRGGYGMSYERNFGNVTFNVIQNPPAQTVVALTAGVEVPSLAISRDNGSVGGQRHNHSFTWRELAPCSRRHRECMPISGAAFERIGWLCRDRYSGSAETLLENISASARAWHPPR